MSSKRRNYRKKSISDDEEGADDNHDLRKKDEEFSESLDTLLEHQKMRRKQVGIDIEKLSKGEKLKKKKKDVNDDPWKLKTGGIVDLEAVRSSRDDDTGEKSSSLKLGAFTQQTNALDVDKHMMAFIESEIKKRRGGTTVQVEDKVEEKEKTKAPYDIYEELYKVPDHLKLSLKPIEEGSMQLSTQMLTAIPEVDLGIDVRLKNIEATERAKRRLLEDQATKSTKKKPESEGVVHVAADRFWQNRHVQSDSEYEALQHLGVQDLDGGQYGGGTDSRGVAPGKGRPANDRRNMATDDIVLERFKKRMRR